MRAASAYTPGGRAAGVRIGHRLIATGAPCFVIAEAGVNHDGQLKLALELVELAAEAGADAVKFQTFNPKALATGTAPKAQYQAARTGADESQRAMLERLALSASDHRIIAQHCRDLGVVFLSTPFDIESADLLVDLGVPAFKIPSGELTHHRFLGNLAERGLPLIVSTGMANLHEVDDALRAIRAAGQPPLALLHCVSAYPAPADACNLRAIQTMEEAFGVPVGWSDHTLGMSVSLAAVARGACIIEKHFTTDRRRPGPDHAASLEPSELSQLIQSIREVESALGNSIKAPQACEQDAARVARRSLIAQHAMSEGHVLVAEDLVALRPGTGMSAAQWDAVIGCPLQVALEPGDFLLESHLGIGSESVDEWHLSLMDSCGTEVRSSSHANPRP